jgi:hypothetical protein
MMPTRSVMASTGVKLSAFFLVGTAGLAVFALARAGRAPGRESGPAQRHPTDAARESRVLTVGAPGHGPTVSAAQRLNRAAGLLAFSVLADSAVEHYRGSFQNKAMFTPLIVSTLTLAMSGHGTADHRPAASALRHAAYRAALLTGIAGGAFHLYNVIKRPGGFCWQNLFYGAPLGAPVAMTLAGLLGMASERVRNSDGRAPARIFGRPAGQLISALSSVGLIGTVGEAGLLHFRGAYHNPFMLAPVTVPPIGAALIALAAPSRSARLRSLARAWLRLTALLGLAGVGFHAYGVQRNMGGWRNWRQNVLNGPPLPAPPSFTGLALAGLAGLRLSEERRDD